MLSFHHPARTVLGSTALAVALMTTAVSAQDLCSTYTVKRGDTLTRIAKVAGISTGYRGLYAANSDILSNPNLIEVGMKLTIPCEGATAAAEPVAETAAEPVAETAAEPAPAPSTDPAAEPKVLPPIRFLTSGDYAPFADQSLPEGGLHVEIVKAAMARGNPDQKYTLSWVDDFELHLTELLPSGAYDAGYMWFMPDCSKVDLYGPEAKLRCTTYLATDAFFEDGVGYYTKAGSPLLNATGYEDLKGKRLCRPEGWFMWDLEAEGLVEPAITMVKTPTTIDCFKALQADEVDVVTFDSAPAEADIVTLKISDSIQEITALASVQTSHVLIPKNNPNGPAYIAMLNKGLAEIRADGTWFSIVSTRMREHEEMNASDN
jgi:Bacterial extracellular solute-binding proteins, family 3/LysM domain